jgi:hypothetical protein
LEAERVFLIEALEGGRRIGANAKYVHFTSIQLCSCISN